MTRVSKVWMSVLSVLLLLLFVGLPAFAKPSPSPAPQTGFLTPTDLPGPFPVRHIRFIQNLPYSTGPGAVPKYQDADLYLPAGKKNVPMLFFIHGGGYRFGDKVVPGLRGIVNLCYDLGMGVMSINYRLVARGNGVTFPMQMHDIATAFAWLRKNGPRYGANPNIIFVMGESAGAHMAAMFGIDPSYLKSVGLSPKDIKGVMLSSGQYDLANVFTLGNARTLLGNQTAVEANSTVGHLSPLVSTVFGTNPKELAAVSPAYYVGKEGKDTPPYMISFCDNDIFGFEAQAVGFYGLFGEHHLPVELVEQPGRTHLTKTGGIDMKIAGADDVLGPSMKRFMQSIMVGTFAAPQNAVYPPPGAPAPAVRTVANLRYYDGPGSSEKFNSLDLYLPEGVKNAPLVFFVHGGGWRLGDKDHPTTLIDMFARMGIGLASVNYRLAPKSTWPVQIEDVARAFDWVYKNAAQYGIDRNRLVVAGGSAGGQLVSLLALDTKYLSDEGVPSDAIKGVVSISGVYDLAAWPEPDIIPTREHVEFGNDPAVIRAASPSTYVSASAPPFLLTFTDWDLFMVRENTLEMYDLMLHKGAPVELVMVPSRTHQGIAEIGKRAMLGIDASSPVYDSLGPAIARFVAGVLHIPPSRILSATLGK
ncbi:MAG TPA: alpha/beta hydrolase [Patescibacteria group bacterium]|nr:alpha/beta hydrolase [Patescibacteria group bacterium]